MRVQRELEMNEKTTVIICFLFSIILIVIFIPLWIIANKSDCQPYQHSWTKAIQLNDKICDFVILCEDDRLVDLIYTGNCINISQWNGQELSKEWCGEEK